MEPINHWCCRVERMTPNNRPIKLVTNTHGAQFSVGKNGDHPPTVVQLIQQSRRNLFHGACTMITS